MSKDYILCPFKRYVALSCIQHQHIIFRFIYFLEAGNAFDAHCFDTFFAVKIKGTSEYTLPSIAKYPQYQVLLYKIEQDCFFFL